MTVGLTHAQEVCFIPAPQPNLENSLLDGQIQVKSQDSEINQDTFAQFKGNVEIDSKQAKIKANDGAQKPLPVDIEPIKPVVNVAANTRPK